MPESLDEFIDRKVSECEKGGCCIQDAAITLLRPVFQELYDLTVKPNVNACRKQLVCK